MRAAIGLFALLLLAFGAFAPSEVDAAVSGACLRVGLVFGFWWFAYPQVQHVPRWFALTAGIMMLAVVIRPKLILFAIPLLAALWLLRPRVPRRDSAARRVNVKMRGR